MEKKKEEYKSVLDTLEDEIKQMENIKLKYNGLIDSLH